MTREEIVKGFKAPTRYHSLVVNGWEVVFRFRDDNRIKVASVNRDGKVDTRFEDHRFDDCDGNEFATLLGLCQNS